MKTKSTLLSLNSPPYHPRELISRRLVLAYSLRALSFPYLSAEEREITSRLDSSEERKRSILPGPCRLLADCSSLSFATDGTISNANTNSKRRNARISQQKRDCLQSNSRSLLVLGDSLAPSGLLTRSILTRISAH